IHAKSVGCLKDNKARTNAADDRGQPDAQDRKHKDDFSLDTSELSAAISPALRDLFNESLCAKSTAFEHLDRETG
ncbi:hypothetical protein AURDEDRAFT_24398, partial [Auricularia subglabra TFB-10046 SS5]